MVSLDTNGGRTRVSVSLGYVTLLACEKKHFVTTKRFYNRPNVGLIRLIKTQRIRAIAKLNVVEVSLPYRPKVTKLAFLSLCSIGS